MKEKYFSTVHATVQLLSTTAITKVIPKDSQAPADCVIIGNGTGPVRVWQSPLMLCEEFFPTASQTVSLDSKVVERLKKKLMLLLFKAENLWPLVSHR